jgi:hypothetical protein
MANTPTGILYTMNTPTGILYTIITMNDDFCHKIKVQYSSCIGTVIKNALVCYVSKSILLSTVVVVEYLVHVQLTVPYSTFTGTGLGKSHAQTPC